MSDKPISELRRRMIADMTVRSFSDKTQHEYIRQISEGTSCAARTTPVATRPPPSANPAPETGNSK